MFSIKIFKTLVCCVSIVLFLSSCQDSDVAHSSSDLTNVSKQSSVIYQNHGTVLYVYSSIDEVVYFAQSLRPFSISGYYKSVNLNDSQLFLQGMNGSKNISLELDSSIYSLGRISGKDFLDMLISTDGNTMKFKENMADITDHCHCVSISKSDRTDCPNGGPGSISCSVTNAGTYDDKTWSRKCTVRCHKGFFSCCPE